jgi:hypothetical protein
MDAELDDDKIRGAVRIRAEGLRLTAYAISKQLGGVPSQESIKRYLCGRSSLSTKYVSRICEVLELEVRPKRKR